MITASNARQSSPYALDSSTLPGYLILHLVISLGDLGIYIYIIFLHTGIPVTTSSERAFLLQTIEKVTIHSTPAFRSFSVFSF